MTTTPRSALIMIFALAFSLALGFAWVVSAQSAEFGSADGRSSGNFYLAQNSPGDERELCLQDCRDAYDPWGGGLGVGGAYAYAACVRKCENRFWRQFDRNTRELEREGKIVR